MCLGPEIAIALAANAAGKMVSDSKAASNAKAKINAKQDSMRQEIELQRVYQAENDAQVQNTLKNFSADKNAQNTADAIAAREKVYAANQPVDIGSYGTVRENAPQVVKTDTAKSLQDALAKSKISAQALAKLGGTGDVFQGNNFGITGAANKIGTTNNLARGSSGVNQFEQVAAANNAGNKSSIIGDLLQTAGSAIGMYGGANGSGSIFGKTTPGSSIQGPLLPGQTMKDQIDPWGYAKVW